MPLILVGFRIAGALSGMVLALILARQLGVAQFGLIAQALSLTMILSLLCTLCIESASPKFMIANLVHRQFAKARAFVQFNLLVLCIMSMATYFATITWYGIQSELFFYAILAAPLVALTRIAAGVSMGFSDVFGAVIPRSFLRQFLFLCGVIGIFWWHPDVELHWVMLCFISANMIVFAVQFFVLHPYWTQLNAEAAGQVIDFEDWRSWLSLGGIIGSVVIFVEFFQHLTILISARTLPAVDVGYLDICMKLAGFMTFGIVAINQSFLPRNTRAFADKDFATLQSLLRQAALIRGGISLLGVLFLLLAGPFILDLFGDDFRTAMPLLHVLTWLPFLVAFFGPAANILSLTDHPAILIKIVALAILSLCLGVWWGSHNLGVIGAAYGVLFSWLIWGGLTACFTWLRLGIDTTLISVFVNHTGRFRNQESIQ